MKVLVNELTPHNNSQGTPGASKAMAWYKSSKALLAHSLYWFSNYSSSNQCWVGWSEPAATSAPIQDEAIEAVLGMN
jgi:hypothetical protein